MKSHYIFTIIAVSLVVMFGSIQNVFAADINETEDLIRQYQQETKCRNVSVVVSKNGETVYYGDSDSLYQIGSMTKAFTGLATQKLINEGLIDEDGIISDYIPGFEAYYDNARADITVRQLLEQKSGYTNSEKDYPSATETMTLSEWADSISGRELNSKPGTEYAYSNVNYNLLGLIIENVTDMSYRDYMEQEILIPLGLNNTYVGNPSDDRIVEGTRLGYRIVHDFPMAVREASIPAGYFYSNASDMGRWIEIWAGSRDEPDNLKDPIEKVKAYLKEEGDYYSGWELFADGVIGHSGGTPNYSSRVVFDEESQTGVCVLSNLNVAATTDSLCNGIYDIETGNDHQGLAGDIWTVFDIIFTCVTAAGIVLLLVSLFASKRSLLIAFDVILVILMVSVLILFPIIFGAGMKEIVFTWAPWSLLGGLLTVAGVIAVTTVRLFRVKRYGDHKKTGKRQAVDGDN